MLAFPVVIQTDRPRAVSPDPRPSIEEVFTTTTPLPAPESTTLLSTLVVLDDEELSAAATSTATPPPPPDSDRDLRPPSKGDE